MLNILISFLTFVLILVSLFLVLVILMQRASSNSGMGSAFGGGVTESAFGADTTNVLVRATKWGALAFFVLSLVLYLLFMRQAGMESKGSETDLPDIPVMTESAPVMDQPVVEAAPSAEELATQADAAASEVMETAESVLSEAQEAVEETDLNTEASLPDTQNPPAP